MRALKSEKEFKELIANDKPVVLDFYADWCGPCISLLPTVEKLAEEYKDDVEIVKVNVDKNADLARQFNVRSIPSLFFLKDGEVLDSLKGFVSEPVLRNKVDALV